MQFPLLTTRVGSQRSRGPLLTVFAMMLFNPGFGLGEDAVVRGKIEYSKANQKSWDSLPLTAPFDRLKATLKEQVE